MISLENKGFGQARNDFMNKLARNLDLLGEGGHTYILFWVKKSRC